MLLGLLLARAGVRTQVLEMHADFDRDFRGDTVHASTLEVLDQIGLADAVLALPHTRVERLSLNTPQQTVTLPPFSRLPTRFPYLAVMPQAELLEFLCREAERYPNFRCLRGAPVQGLLFEQSDAAAAPSDRVVGVTYRDAGAPRALRAGLTVGADGRFSRLRKLAGLQAPRGAPPMDVCWFRIPRHRDDDGAGAGLYFGHGRIVVGLPRPDEWQLGYVFPKGDFQALKALGLQAFRDAVRQTAPWVGGRMDGISTWDQVHLLAVQADCLPTWHRPGLLLIGDAAHVMSPVGGVGINMAIGDAVEAANVLAAPAAPLLRAGPPPQTALAEVQRRRLGATRLTQRFQQQIQQRLVARELKGRDFELPWIARLVLATPGLRQLPLRLISLGIPQAKLEC